MAKYARNCGSNPTCYDFGRLHNGGPNGCHRSSTDAYVAAMKRKCHLRETIVKPDLFSKFKAYYRNYKIPIFI